MDVKRLLEGFLGPGGAAASGGGQIKDMVNKGLAGLPSGAGLGNLPGGLAGGLSGSLPGGLAGGAAAGGLIALLMGSKKARKIGGKALTYGGLAVVGGLAYKAWSDYKAGQQGQPVSVPQLPAPPAGGPFDLASQTDAQGSDMRLALVRAMISAAKADGHIDQDEDAQIRQQIQSMELAADEKAFLFDQLAAPSDPIAIARLSRGEEQAAELYLASALAVDVDTPEEQRYLDRLADALHLPGELRAQLDQHVAAAKAG